MSNTTIRFFEATPHSTWSVNRGMLVAVGPDEPLAAEDEPGVVRVDRREEWEAIAAGAEQARGYTAPDDQRDFFAEPAG